MNNSYKSILKSTSTIGGAQILIILFGIIRSKILALLLGPAGLGIVGLYLTTIELFITITGMGIKSSGVRQIAIAFSTGNTKRISITIKTLRIVSLLSGVIGMLLLLLLCRPVSLIVFGDYHYITGLSIVSLSLLFSNINAGQYALLQGLRKINDLAKTQILGSIFGTISSAIVIFYLRENGISFYLLTVSAFSILTSWWYARRIKVSKVRMHFNKILAESKNLVKLGFAFMVSSLLVTGLSFLFKIIIKNELGIESVGYYQATFTLSTLYVGLVLNAMGADYYPRLTAVANDDELVNNMVNDQTEMGLLLGLPGVLLILTLSPWLLKIFYSDNFSIASDILRWQMIGVTLRVTSWPIAFVQLAKGSGKIFIATELMASLIHLLLFLWAIEEYDLVGVGIAFTLMYLFYTVIIYLTGKKLSGFSWRKETYFIISISFTFIILAFFNANYFSLKMSIIFNLSITMIVTLWCIIELQKRLKISFYELIIKFKK